MSNFPTAVPLAQFVFVCLISAANVVAAEAPTATFSGIPNGPDKAKKIVLVSGDEEYRSEEALPQLAKILAARHGFDCTVLFAVDPHTGEIDPDNRRNIPGLDALDAADLMVLFTRRRDLPEEQMRKIVEYVESGRPIIGMRTATHAFHIDDPRKPFAKYSDSSKVEGSQGGFGRRVLGETWIAHHGKHGVQSTRGLLAPDARHHPIVRGIDDGDIWGPTDVYRVRLPLPGDCRPLVLGQVLQGMKPDDLPVKGKVNDPLMPIAWTKTYTGQAGKPARVFTTTMGSSQDLQSQGFRRLLVNACYWCLALEEQITPDLSVELVGEYQPSPYGFGGFKKGVKPADHMDSPREMGNLRDQTVFPR